MFEEILVPKSNLTIKKKHHEETNWILKIIQFPKENCNLIVRWFSLPEHKQLW